ncbi:DUF2971 domain-containing protein [Bacillus thuringiensis]|uniref:DUF2971 domain-containing protein n=1 Tax=Bacillus thuringiensis TaxID=1428 RepID=UPI000BF3BCBA|nr:DUF2971 domain-containing protein [Bacillus thuringiensis]PEW92364.1 DUF2971 domain-containing protein [Bacillus thuringiensis]
MVYNPTAWNQTHKSRTDLTSFLTHLTRPQFESNLNETDVLIKILREATLLGSTAGYIVGQQKVVCFQEAPLYSVAENAINHIEEHEKDPSIRLRYYPCGVTFPKHYLYQFGDNNGNAVPNLGVRPVIYEKTDVAKSFLPPSQHWRIVDLELHSMIYPNSNITDWMHEREWRVCTDAIHFHYAMTTVLLRDSNQYREFMNKIEPDIVKQLAGIVCLDKLLY